MRARRGISARYIKAINFVKKRFASPFSGLGTHAEYDKIKAEEV